MMNIERINDDIENGNTLMRSLQNLADLTADPFAEAHQDRIVDVHCGFDGIDESE